MAWSLANSMLSRLGTFIAGIVLARYYLGPEDYGVFAAASVILTLLLGFNELGVSVAVVRRPGTIDPIVGTVITLSICSSLAIAALGYLAAPALAGLLGAPEATAIMRILLLGVAIDGIAAVPNAVITRHFLQRTRLMIDLAAFVVGTGLTLVLAARGFGAWSLAWGALAGNVVGGGLSIARAPVRFIPGWNAAAAREVISFGLPLAGSSMLLIGLLNIDYIVVGNLLGPVQLGLYLLAFNLCSWPIAVFTSALRRVALPFFAKMSLVGGSRDGGFATVLALVLVVTVPMCLGLGLLAKELVVGLYGDTWSASAAALAPLAIFTMMRITAELVYDFLAAHGRSRSTLLLYVVWLVVLVPTLVVATERWGIRGTGWGHAVAGAAVVLPLALALVRRVGVSPVALLRACSRPLVGALVMAGVILVLRRPAHALIGHDLVVAIVVGALGLLPHLALNASVLRQARMRLAGPP